MIVITLQMQIYEKNPYHISLLSPSKRFKHSIKLKTFQVKWSNRKIK